MGVSFRFSPGDHRDVTTFGSLSGAHREGHSICAHRESTSRDGPADQHTVRHLNERARDRQLDHPATRPLACTNPGARDLRPTSVSPASGEGRTRPGPRTQQGPAPANGDRALLRLQLTRAADRGSDDHLRIFVTWPEPTVRPPSRMAKPRPSSIAMGWMSVTVISVLSPGMTISVPSGSVMTPVTSVVRK